MNMERFEEQMSPEDFLGQEEDMLQGAVEDCEPGSEKFKIVKAAQDVLRAISRHNLEQLRSQTQ